MSVGTRGALIVGSSPPAVQAALDLANSGIPVTLVESSPFVGEPGSSSQSNSPLLQLYTHPNLKVLTTAQVTAIETEPYGDMHVRILSRARYVDLERCTACGDCVALCPMPLIDPITLELSDRCAIYKEGALAVPNVYAIEKEGTAPCRSACPIDQRAQGYVALIRERRFAEAYRAIKEENPFPSVCGRVCNHRCETACNRGKVDEPVNIMGLKRFVADWAAEHPAEVADVLPHPVPEFKGKRVAIVGAGPAGLTAAYDLVRMGYGATVFEAQPVAGGMMRLGVPEHRLPAHVLQREIDEILAAGVELRLNHRVDDMERLLGEGFDAVFIAVGAHRGVELPISGTDLPDVHLATDFLRSASLGAPVDVDGKRVLVIGGGNVGLDVAQTAVRTGAAWVGVACLETREGMPAFEHEIRDAEQEGVEIYACRTFKEITGTGYVDEEWVTGVRCAQVDFRGFVDGRPDMDELPGTEEVIPADIVVFAVGQWPDLTGVPDELERFRGRWLMADAGTQVTNLPGFTAGGDVVTGTSFIVDAIAAGHRAALALHTYLLTGEAVAWGATNPSQEVVEFTDQQARAKLRGPDARYAANLPRHEFSRLPPELRKQSFVEMFGGFTEAEAVEEARRCLVCGACSECLACVYVCQANAIDHYQQPAMTTHQVSAILWADERVPVPETVAGQVLIQTGPDPLLMSALTAQVMAACAPCRARPAPAAQPQILADTTAPRLGVFLCRCGGKIGEKLEMNQLAERVSDLPGVVLVQELDFACHPEAAQTIREAMTTDGLDRIVLAACSCCSLDQTCDSCTYQRVRCKTNLLGLPFQWASLPGELVNIREQCAWAHPDQPDLATAKAVRLVAAAAAKARLSSYAPRPVVEMESRVLVVGDTEAAVICANALRVQSIAVAHCEEIPRAISGSMGGFSIHLQSDGWQWQVEASTVILAPADAAQVAHLSLQPGIYLCSPEDPPREAGLAMATTAGAALGSGRLMAHNNVAWVDPARCLGCGTCQTVCEVQAITLEELIAPQESDPILGLMEILGTARPAEEPRLVAKVNPAVCQGCATCAAQCPSSAIAAGYSTDHQIEAMLAAILTD